MAIGFVGIAACSFGQGPEPTLQRRLVGGPCEGCEAVFEYGTQKLQAADTLPGFNATGKRLHITGTIYLPDGKTPAKDVILYVYHTNAQGIYPTRGDEKGWGKRHGYIRGWMKTGDDGRYSFYTMMPGTYPNGGAPAHIHPLILEPNGRYYYVEEYLFAGDPLMDEKQLKMQKPRGGSQGVITMQKKGEYWEATRDFVLGRNIPGYE